MKKQQFTLTVITENEIGLLNKVVVVFTRRKINIDSLTASESGVKGVYRYTIVIDVTEDQVKKVCAQIEKFIGVLKVFYYKNDEVERSEMALYKMPATADRKGIDALIEKYNAYLFSETDEYIVIQKTGYKHETEDLFKDLDKFGILEFARSGRIAVTKPMNLLTQYLQGLKEKEYKHN